MSVHEYRPRPDVVKAIQPLLDRTRPYADGQPITLQEAAAVLSMLSPDELRSTLAMISWSFGGVFIGPTDDE